MNREVRVLLQLHEDLPVCFQFLEDGEIKTQVKAKEITPEMVERGRRWERNTHPRKALLSPIGKTPDEMLEARERARSHPAMALLVHLAQRARAAKQRHRRARLGGKASKEYLQVLWAEANCAWNSLQASKEWVFRFLHEEKQA